MTKTFKLEELDCANCAAKMEDAINKMPEVESAIVSFMMQKLTITCADEITKDFMKRVAKVCKKIEPDCRILY